MGAEGSSIKQNAYKEAVIHQTYKMRVNFRIQATLQTRLPVMREKENQTKSNLAYHFGKTKYVTNAVIVKCPNMINK